MDPNDQPSWPGGDAPDKEKMDQVSHPQNYPTLSLWGIY